MKVSHDNIQLIETWIEQNSLEIDFTDEFVAFVYEQVLERYYSLKNISNKKSILRAYTLQYHFVRRDLLKIKYKRNNMAAKDIKEGFVYAITNPSWPGFVKIGSAIDVYDRLGTYQTSSPFRDYSLIGYTFSHDRLQEEKKLLNSLHPKFGEWCEVDSIFIKNYFRHKNTISFEKYIKENLYDRKN